MDIRIGSEQERQQAEAALRDYEQRKAKVRRVLEEVLATECRRMDGWLFEKLSDGYREQTGVEVDEGMVSDFLSELPDRLFPSKPKPKPTPKEREATGPRPVAVIGRNDEEEAVSGGWTGAFRYIALAVAKDNPGRTDIWLSLWFVQRRDQLPDYLKDVAANVEVAPGWWLNTHGNAELTRRKTREMLDAFNFPRHKYRLRLADGTIRPMI